MNVSYLPRLFLSSNRWANRAVAFFHCLHQGLWMGVMDNDQLQHVTELWYGDQNMYREGGYNTSGLFSWEAAAIDAYFGEVKCVLVGAAGGGREVIALARRGVRVTGFECNAALVQHARRLIGDEGLQAECLDARPGEVPDAPDTFDGFIMGWAGYTHLAPAARRVTFLQHVRERLVDGAPMMLSYHTRPAGSKAFEASSRLAQVIRKCRFSSEVVETGDALYTGFSHSFTQDEIVKELRSAGFEPLFFGDDKATVPHVVARAVAGASRDKG